MSERASHLLEVVNRVREMHDRKTSSPHSSKGGSLTYSRSHSSDEEDQPLDFSSKKPKIDYGLLGSDGHSDNSSTHSNSSPVVSPKRDSLSSNTNTPVDFYPSLASTSANSNPSAATLNFLSVALQQQQNQQISQSPRPYNPLLFAAAAVSPGNNFPALASRDSKVEANLLELSKVNSRSQKNFAEFRDDMMQKIEASRPKGRRSGSQKLSEQRRPRESSENDESFVRDEAYWERRKKNNEAAKRSRDARRNKENEVAVRAQFLEQENVQLKLELAQLRTDIAKLTKEGLNGNKGPDNPIP